MLFYCELASIARLFYRKLWYDSTAEPDASVFLPKIVDRFLGASFYLVAPAKNPGGTKLLRQTYLFFNCNDHHNNML